MEELNNIVNGNYKVTEKQRMLSAFREKMTAEINKAAHDITKGYKFCPKCGEYYKEKAWEIEHKSDVREVCTFHSLAEFEDDTYEKKICTVTYGICPMGHIFEEDVTW